MSAGSEIDERRHQQEMNRPGPAEFGSPASMPRPKTVALSGWGRFPISHNDVYRPEKLREIAALVASDPRSLIARGAGRAYGDAALNAGNRVVEMGRLNRMLAFDPEAGILHCEAGVTIAEILDAFLSRGFFPAVTPGTRFVTLGGSIAADVHGKNHHRDSSLAAHVLWFDLMLASGEIKRCSPARNSDLFWATVGGMGLTGVILELAMRLRRIASAYIEGQLARVANLDEAIDRFEEADRDWEYSVAWIDCLSARNTLGRSVLSFGNFAAPEVLPPKLRPDPFGAARARIRAAIPFNLPRFILSTAGVRAFNAAYYAAHRSRTHIVAPYERFFFPLDAIHDWNRLYGRRGFVQYQCVWPAAQSRAGLIEVLEAVSQSGRGSFLAVLKKFGPQDGMLSFPMEGYTLALDFPVTDGLLAFLDRLDEMVLRRGGRVYLAKDARLRPEVFHAMYPNFARWQQVKGKSDPNNRFSSTLSRRLRMDPA